MFAARYFTGWYFARRYFPAIGAGATPPQPSAPAGVTLTVPAIRRRLTVPAIKRTPTVPDPE